MAFNAFEKVALSKEGIFYYEISSIIRVSFKDVEYRPYFWAFYFTSQVMTLVGVYANFKNCYHKRRLQDTVSDSRNNQYNQI